jgi:hypothetical protein
MVEDLLLVESASITEASIALTFVSDKPVALRMANFGPGLYVSSKMQAK